MMRSLVAGLGLLALGAALPASAADLPRQSMPYKAPAYVPAVYNWTGFYLGINGGGAWGKSDWTGYGSGNKPSGGMVGVTVGYNWQAVGSQWVWGLEGDIDWTDIDATHVCTVATTCQTKNSWFGTARGRVGYAVDRVMPYFTGGAAFGDIKVSETGFAGAKDSHVGWTVGAGVEAAFAPNWSAKVEYLYADFGDTGCNAIQCSLATNVGLQMNILRGGVNYRF